MSTAWTLTLNTKGQLVPITLTALRQRHTRQAKRGRARR
jgi:hypothetical protein